MKTIYNKLKLPVLLKPLALMILFLALVFNARSQSSNSPVCEGSADIQLACSGGVITTCDDIGVPTYPRYSWLCTATGFTSTQKNPTIPIGDPFYLEGTYFLTVWYGPGPNQFENGFTTVVFIDPLTPGIASADQIICPNSIPIDDLTCTIFGGGAGINNIYYYWEYSTDGVNWLDAGKEGVGPFPLYLVPAYDFPLGALTETTQYRVMGVNQYCPDYDPEYSNVVTITVQDPPLPGTIAANQDICYETTPVNLTGDDPADSYDWEYSLNGVDWFPVVPAQTTPGFDFGTTTFTETTMFRRWSWTTCISNDPSNVVTITVQSVPTAGEIAENQTICYTTTPADLTSLSPGTGDGTITYNWESSLDGMVWTPALPENHAADFAFGTTTLTETTMYRRITVSTVGTTECYSAPTNYITVFVQPEIPAGTIEESQTICYNTTPDDLIGSEITIPGASISYIWEYNVPPSLDWDVDLMQIGKDYLFSVTTLTETTNYRRTTVSVVGGNTCYSVATGVLTITVSDPPEPGDIYAPQTICYESTPLPLTGDATGTSYDWERSTDGMIWGPADPVQHGQGFDFGTTTLTETTMYRRWSYAGTCKSLDPSNTVTIEVQSVPTAGEIAENQTICNGETPADLTSTMPGTGDGTITYNWESSADGMIWVPVVPESHSEGFAFGTATLTETTMYHRITVSTVGTTECYSDPTPAVTITVQAVIPACEIAASQTICYSATPEDLTYVECAPPPVPGYTYSWESSENGIDWLPAVPDQDGPGFHFGSTTLTTTTMYRRYTHYIVGVVECISDATEPVTIVVQDLPTAGEIALNQTICSGYAADDLYTTVPATGSGTLSYVWYNSLNAIDWNIIPGETGEGLAPGILTETTYFRRSTLSTVGSSECPSAGYTNIIEVFTTDVPVAGVTGPDELCQNECAYYYATGWLPGDTFEWSVSGTYTSIEYFENYIWVCWGECTEGEITVTICRGNCCDTSDPFHVTLFAAPDPQIVGPATVNNGATTTYYALPGNPDHLFNWTALNGTIVSGQGTPSIQVLWDSPCLGCEGQVCVYESDPAIPECSHGSACMSVYILPDNANVFGYVTYENNYLTGVNNVELTLRNAVDYSIVGTCTSGPNLLSNGESGYFAFVGIPDGDYILTADNYVYDGGYYDSYGNYIWGGNNATDALIVQMNVPGPLTTPTKTLAADVNGSLTISALDALYIKLRVVELIDAFPAGDWAFVPATFTIDALNPVKDFGQTFLGLCYGDVNGSFVPTGMKSATSLNAIEDGVQTIPVEQSFNYDIRSNGSADLGAMTLTLNFDQSLFEVEKVTTSLEGLQYKVANGKLVVAWSDVNALSVNGGEPILSVSVKAKEEITNPTQIFTIGENSEFANTKAEPMNFDLKMSNVITGEQNFSMVNYPNPFRNTTTIAYTMPEAGQVRLVITDMFGKTLSVLVDAMQEAGTHTFVVNPANVNLSQGVYLYKIDVTGAFDTYSKVNKFIFQK